MDVIKAKLIKRQSRIFPFKLLQRKNLLFYILSKWIEDQTRRVKTDVGDPCYRLAASKEGETWSDPGNLQDPLCSVDHLCLLTPQVCQGSTDLTECAHGIHNNHVLCP